MSAPRRRAARRPCWIFRPELWEKIGPALFRRDRAKFVQALVGSGEATQEQAEEMADALPARVGDGWSWRPMQAL